MPDLNPIDPSTPEDLVEHIDTIVQGMFVADYLNQERFPHEQSDIQYRVIANLYDFASRIAERDGTTSTLPPLPELNTVLAKKYYKVIRNWALQKIQERKQDIGMGSSFPKDRGISLVDTSTNDASDARTENPLLLNTTSQSSPVTIPHLSRDSSTSLSLGPTAIECEKLDKLIASLRPGVLRKVIEAYKNGEKLTPTIIREMGRKLTNLKADASARKDKDEAAYILDILSRIPAN